MANFGLILVCLSLGLLLRRLRAMPANAPASLNAFIMMVSLPAVALLNLHGITLSRAMLYPVGMAWLVFGAAFVFFTGLRKVFGWSRETTGALILTAGLCNTSFVGYPLLVALYGPEALRIGVLTDQPGSFLVLSSLGMAVASAFSSQAGTLASLPLKLLKFPPFVAMCLALVLNSWVYPAALQELLEKLAATLIPLALVSVGMQLGITPAALRKNARALGAGLFFKLALGPALIYLLYVIALGARGQEIQITIVQAAMAPMITGAILASDYGLDPGLANLMIGIGIPLSLLSVPIWAYFIRAI